MSVIKLLSLLIKIYPAFVNIYYDECVSQQLAAVCLPFHFPTWQAIQYFLGASL